MESNLFYQSVTANHFFVCESKHITIVDTRIISAIKYYFVRWYYDGVEQTEFLSSQDMKFIADAMEVFYGSISESTQAWNALYLKCLHDECCVLNQDSHDDK